MKAFLILSVLFLSVTVAGVYFGASPVKCEDCNQGKQCNTSYDCGQIGVCYCQYSYEEEVDTGGGIPDFGTCYFE